MAEYVDVEEVVDALEEIEEVVEVDRDLSLGRTQSLKIYIGSELPSTYFISGPRMEFGLRLTGATVTTDGNLRVTVDVPEDE